MAVNLSPELVVAVRAEAAAPAATAARVALLLRRPARTLGTIAARTLTAASRRRPARAAAIAATTCGVERVGRGRRAEAATTAAARTPIAEASTTTTAAAGPAITKPATARGTRRVPA